MKKIVLAFIIFVALLSIEAAANESLLNEWPHNVYHVIQNKTLQEAIDQLATRSGIIFKLNPAIEADIIDQKLAANDWNEALNQLLLAYNHSAIWENGKIKTVIISGRNHNGGNPVAAPVPENEMVVIAPKYTQKLPAKYKNYTAGSVTAINLPLAEIKAVAKGSKVVLDLPVGQYVVNHDNVTDHADGSSTWAGYLDNEGKGYRVYLSTGIAGVMGNVFTPDGEYAIESNGRQIYFIDIAKSGLKNGGFDNDTKEIDQPAPVAPSVAHIPTMAAQTGTVSAAISSTDLAKLKADADTKRAFANTLSAAVQVLDSRHSQALAIVNQAKAASDQAQLNLQNDLDAITSLKGSLQTDSANAASLRTSLNAALFKWHADRLQTNGAAKTLKDAQIKEQDILVVYNKKLSAFNEAVAIAKAAEDAYNAAKPQPRPVSNTIDVMVLYTIANTGKTPAETIQDIQYLVDISNQAYSDSGIDLAIRLVHTEPTAYTDSSTNAAALDDLGVGGFSGTGTLANVRSLNDQYNPDVVVLLRPYNATTAGGNCGIAPIGFMAGRDTPGFATGNAVVSFGRSTDGSLGTCGINTFTHEIGHLLGNTHDREYSSAQGRFDYSYAWGIANKFGTIMSYYGPNLMLFSTPNLPTQCAGGPCGFAAGNPKSSDQSATINATAPVIANLKPSTTVTPVVQ